MVGEQPVVTKRHILLLPLLIQGFATALQQYSLRTETRSGRGPAHCHRATRAEAQSEARKLPMCHRGLSDQRPTASPQEGRPQCHCVTPPSTPPSPEPCGGAERPLITNPPAELCFLTRKWPDHCSGVGLCAPQPPCAQPHQQQRLRRSLAVMCPPRRRQDGGGTAAESSAGAWPSTPCSTPAQGRKAP